MIMLEIGFSEYVFKSPLVVTFDYMQQILNIHQMEQLGNPEQFKKH